MQQNVTHLILPDVRFDLGKSDLEGEMHRKQQQQQQNKQAKNKQTKNGNKAMRTLKTYGPKDRLFIYHYH